MDKTKGGTGRGLVLAGLLIACLVFALTAAICVRIFAGAHQTAAESKNLSCAVTAAVGGVEVFKATGGDREQTAEILGAQITESGALCVFYDAQWRDIDASRAKYVMEITWLYSADGMVRARVDVSEKTESEILYSLQTAAAE